MKGFVETAFVSFWIQSIARFPGEAQVGQTPSVAII